MHFYFLCTEESHGEWKARDDYPSAGESAAKRCQVRKTQGHSSTGASTHSPLRTLLGKKAEGLPVIFPLASKGGCQLTMTARGFPSRVMTVRSFGAEVGAARQSRNKTQSWLGKEQALVQLPTTCSAARIHNVAFHAYFVICSLFLNLKLISRI